MFRARTFFPGAFFLTPGIAMAQARPEYAITVAIVGVLLAVGIPAIRRGQFILGGVLIFLALSVTGWAIRAVLQERE